MQESSKRGRMFTLIEKWKESGKTQKQFSREQGITYSKFLYWTRKYRLKNLNIFRANCLSGNIFVPNTLTLTEPLYERLKNKMLNEGYLQVDETPLRVLELIPDYPANQLDDFLP